MKLSTSAPVLELIGNTPLIQLQRASELTGCRIFGKAEFMNPGQSVKDRAALGILRAAEKSGALLPGGRIVDGSAGNTGIGLAMVGAALGYRTTIVMPRTQSEEKKAALRAFGADLVEVDAVPYSEAGNYIHVAERLAKELNEKEPNGAFWANQFDNTANRDFHQETTGEEIWKQTAGAVDGFVCAVGTGGTLGGVSRALKAHNPGVTIAVSDPFGSKIHSWVSKGVLESSGGSITEGIGQGRVTENLADTEIDLSFQIDDATALNVLYDLVLHEGLCLGGSSGVNVAGAIELARSLGPGHTIVTILCDSGSRYASKLYNPAFLSSKSLPAPPWMKSELP